MVHNMDGGAADTIIKYAAITAPVMTPVTEQPYFFSKAELKFGGVPFGKFRNFSISINNQLDPRYYIKQSASTDNRQILSEILEGRRAITISGSLDMDDTASTASAGAQTGPDIKFLQYLFNQGFTQGDPRDVLAANMHGVNIEVELRRYADVSESTKDFDTLTFTLPSTAASSTNPGLILSAARMPIPSPPQVHQNLDIEGVTTSMKIDVKDSIAT